MRSWLLSLLAVSLLSSSPGIAEKLTLEALTGPKYLSGPTLEGTKISPNAKYVSYLKGKASNRFQLDLWVTETESGASKLLVDSQLIMPGPENISDEEKARRERQRTAFLSGIAEYQWAPDSKALLFPFGGELYWFELDKALGSKARKLTSSDGFATDAQISPKGKYVSFVRARNLWVVEVASGKETQLTNDANETVAYGVAEFVADEEMNRHTGYWWSPDDSTIALTRIDESQVPIKKRIEVYADRTAIVDQRYPAAGDPNVLIQLGVISASGGKIRWIDLGENQDIYLTRVNWIDPQNLSFQRMSRDQGTLDLLAVDLKTNVQKKLLTEKSDTWITPHDNLRFQKNGDFLWTSSRSGFEHLYLYSGEGKLKQQLTSGDWVFEKLLTVNEDAKRIYFSANKDSPLERHIYRVSLDGGEIQRLSRQKGMHDAKFSEDATLFIDTWSNTATPPQSELYSSDGTLKTVLLNNTIDKKHPYFKYWKEHRPVEFGSLPIMNRDSLYYSLVKPSGFQAGKKYPVVVLVYGGPGVQIVKESWGADLRQYLAQQGYVVFSLDNRGSSRRGKKFESAIFHNLGSIEVEDQMRGIAFLKTLPYVDAKRIGVQGWSYGGYMTLMLLAKHSEAFQCGAAGAPVTDWKLYDTFYTESFMGTPQSNPEAYRLSAVTTHLNGLKSKLLLMHGMADDNVLFQHSTEIMSDLQKRGIAFELMTYPGAKHGLLRDSVLGLHGHKTIVSFLERCLKQ